MGTIYPISKPKVNTCTKQQHEQRHRTRKKCKSRYNGAMENDRTHEMSDVRPYLLRHGMAWIEEQGLTPHLAINPTPEWLREHRIPVFVLRDGQLILNISEEATNLFSIDGDAIRTQVMMPNGVTELVIPHGLIDAIFAMENGMGMEIPTTLPGRGTNAQPPAMGAQPGLTVVTGNPEGGKPTMNGGDHGPEDGPKPPRRTGHLTLVK